MQLADGVLWALVALVGWGLGDFFIQRGTRLVGLYQTLFIICAASTVLLFPFIHQDIAHLSALHIKNLLLLSVVIFAYALVLFEAFRRGKISVVEAVVGLELPLTVALGVFIGGEHMTPLQIALFLMVSGGILLAVTERIWTHKSRRSMLEKGALFALFGAALSALTNFSVGTNAQEVSPLMTIWFTHTILALMCLIAMLWRQEIKQLAYNIRRHPAPLLALCIFDNAAWIGFAFATTLIPISLAATISESYIALAALLGFFINKERLRPHQFAGIGIAIIGVIVLATTLSA